MHCANSQLDRIQVTHLAPGKADRHIYTSLRGPFQEPSTINFKTCRFIVRCVNSMRFQGDCQLVWTTSRDDPEYHEEMP